MKVIERYIIFDFLKTFLYCLCLFVSMYIIMDILGHIDEFVKDRVSPYDLALYYLSFLPFIFVNTSPVAVLLSTVFILGNLNKTSEITAMKACGLSLFDILKPLLFTGIVISLLVFVINEKVATQTNIISSNIKESKIEKDKKTGPSNISNVALYGSGNLIIFSKKYDTKNQVLRDIIIQKHNNHQRVIAKEMARRADWTNQQWIGSDVTSYNLDKSGYIVGVPEYYASKKLSIKEGPEEFIKKEWQTDFMNFKQLKSYIDRFSGTTGDLMNHLLVEMHYKLSFPFVSFIIIVVGAPFALYSHRGGAMIGFGMSVVICLVYYAAMAIFMAMGKAGILPPLISVWLAHALFLSTGIFLLVKRS